jgi:phage gp16-like protein
MVEKMCWNQVVLTFCCSQRKLSAPEYKNVDEQYRVATIKHTTTKVAADDLKKYYSALDRVGI